MKELKSRKEKEETLYIEDIKDSDFIGVECKQGRAILCFNENGKVIGLTRKCENDLIKWETKSKAEYVDWDFDKVLKFENEVEMLLWYNGK